MTNCTRFITVIFIMMLSFNSKGQTFIRIQTQKLGNGQFINKIKWFTLEMIVEKGVNIYRKEISSEEWVKLNPSPIIHQMESIDDKTRELIKKLQKTTINDTNKAQFQSFFEKVIHHNEFAQTLGLMFIDSTLIKDKVYQYKLTKANSNDDLLLAYSENITIHDSVSTLFPPKEIQIIAGNKKSYFSWNPDQDRLVGVNIYRLDDNTKSFLKINTTPIPPKYIDSLHLPYIVFYIDGALEENHTYSYQFTGVDYFGDETVFSKTISIRIKDRTPPPPPENVVFSVNKDLSMKIKWQSKPANDLLGYSIHKYDSTNRLIYGSPIIDKKEFTDNFCKTGKFIYHILAIDTAENASWSEPLIVNLIDTFPPEKPVIASIRYHSGELQLSLKNNGENDFYKYFIYRSIDSLNFDLIKELYCRDSCQFYDDQLSKNLKYKLYYKIEAVDSSLNRSEPSAIKSAKLPYSSEAFPPQITDITFSQDSLFIKWLPCISKNLQGYSLYYLKPDDTIAYLINEKIIPTDQITYGNSQSFKTGNYDFYVEALENNKIIGKSDLFRKEFQQLDHNDKVFIKTIKVKKEKKTNLVQWQLKDPNKESLGVIVYRKNENTFTQISGLIKKGNFFEDNDNNQNNVYLIKVFLKDDKVVSSNEIKPKDT